MPDSNYSALLDIPDFPADGYAALADRIGALLGTTNDVLLVQGEAIIALEAVATSIGGPTIRALNVVTSPYGRWFGEWLRRQGSVVTDVIAEPGKQIRVAEVETVLSASPDVNLVALVHAESASGILNPLPEIAALAKARGALLVVDAVASFGGHPFDIDRLEVDVAVVGPQKSLAGSSGLSAVSVSSRAWSAILKPDAPRLSTLSLLDLKLGWIDSGRGVLPGMPSALEFHALAAALDRVEAEGLDAIVSRHASAASATRAGVCAMGLRPWVEDADASNLVTTVLLPEGIDRDAILNHPLAIEAKITSGVGEGTERLVRLNHTGQRATPEHVRLNLTALAGAISAAGHSTLDGLRAPRIVS